MAEQLITVRMNRGDSSSPWGFRLQGGKDWGTPLAISKVAPGSLAEQAGLQLGDCVVKISNQNADQMLHHEAQDAIKMAKNNLDMQVQRGSTSTWRPQISAVGDLPRPGSVVSPVNVTRTSLAKNNPPSQPIGSSHNVKAKPFGNDRFGPLVHKQYNSPMNLYSEDNIKEALDAHTEQLAPGVMGINFMKPDAPVNKQSAVYQAILEEEQSHHNQGNRSHHHRLPFYQNRFPTEESRSLSPTFQSNSFRRLEQALATGKEVKSGLNVMHTQQQPSQSKSRSPSPRPASAYHPSSVVKHVDAPVTRPGQSRPQNDNLNICGQCGGLITGVFCKIKDKNLHPECFRCSTCGTSLKNIGYFNINDKLYCEIHAGQAASQLNTNSNYEPVTVRPRSVPRDAQIVGVGGAGGMATPTSPTPGQSQPIRSIPSPSSALYDRPSSPGVLGAVPWHQTIPGSIHHVDAPQSPRPFQTASPSGPPPPVAPKPQYKPMSPPMQTRPTFYGEYNQQKQQQIVNQSSVSNASCKSKPSLDVSKFTWPPPKQNEGEYSSSFVPTYRPPPETVRVNESSRYEPNANTFSESNKSIGSSVNIASGPLSRRAVGQLQPKVGPGVRIPICSQCGSPIRGPFIVALGKTWCPDHFNCANSSCRRSLMNIGFVEEKGQLYCEICFESYFAPNCCKCSQKVKSDCLIALDKHWHPHCFACRRCEKTIGKNKFFSEDGFVYCQRCWDEFTATLCSHCNYPIEPGDRWIEALNGNYHSNCFKCCLCDRKLEGEPFYAKAGRPFCKSHAK